MLKGTIGIQAGNCWLALQWFVGLLYCEWRLNVEFWFVSCSSRMLLFVFLKIEEYSFVALRYYIGYLRFIVSSLLCNLFL